MIDRPRLLSDLQRLLRNLEGDLHERCGDNPEIDAPLRQEYERARGAGRTAHAYEIWREDHLTQAAVAWILACVFVRFLEDNGLVDTPRLAGVGDRLTLARDHHTVYISRHPTETDREYLLSVFRETARLPSMAALLDERHNPLFRLGLSADGARALLEFWQKIDPATGALVHDFTDPGWNTRFLGDLYQDLSESARKTYALLQTPEFVEEFILDRTLEPAIQEFGYQAVRLIDPACGSGHFLLGAFRRIFERWARHEPATNPRALAQRTLDALSGVDLNPFAVAIARFRLLLAALEVCDVRRLTEAPGFRINLATGDSLLHGTRPARMLRGVQRDLLDEPLRHAYETEDVDELRRILGQHYHAVVGNPPYITPKDSALNQAYRERFGSCHMKYSLAVPFMERLFDLVIDDGFVGMITANSFMKREFGKKLIEEFIPRWDLTHIVDTSGVPVPEHGTSTVILFGRHRAPVAPTIRAVLGIRGDPPQIPDPAKGSVWTAIIAQIDQPSSQSTFVSVGDLPRKHFHLHPWSIGGGGASDLKNLLDSVASQRLGALAESIGPGCILGEDEVLDLLATLFVCVIFRPIGVAPSLKESSSEIGRTEVLYPYSGQVDLCDESEIQGWLWPFRVVLSARLDFSKQTYADCGRPYWEYHQIPIERNRIPLSIAIAFVSTHNHFVLDRGGKVFNRSAPVIKLPAEASEDDHLSLVGLLNSSTACFWFKQVFYCKGVGGINEGSKEETWERFFEFDSTKLQRFPVPSAQPLHLSSRLDATSGALRASRPDAIIASPLPTQQDLEDARERATSGRQQMIALQEELDWQCYRF